MGHEHLSGTPVELMQILKTAFCSNHLFHPPLAAFKRIEMMTAMGR